MNKDELLKIYSAYLPYGLELQHKYEKAKHNGETILRSWVKPLEHLDLGCLFPHRKDSFDWKPILYDLSYLTKPIELKNELGHTYPEIISIIDYLNIAKSDRYTYHPKLNCIRLNSYGKGYTQWNFNVNGQLELPYRIFQLLIINHFNVFGLPEDQFINKATLTNK